MNDRHTRCCAFLLNENLELLLVEHENKRGDRFWWLPGGGLEENESHEEGIRREIYEELNVNINICQIFYLEASSKIRLYKQFCVAIGNIIGSRKIELEKDGFGKILQYKWFPINNEKEFDPILFEDDIYIFIKEAKKYL